jgi:putative flippase GtrA
MASQTSAENSSGEEHRNLLAQHTKTVDIAIPVLNEERALDGCVRTLHEFLTNTFPLGWRITIVDNGSTDETWAEATRLSGELDSVHAIRLDVRGRGNALRAAWTTSPCDIVAYMDVDLATGLSALLPMVSALASGHSELAIGSRLARGARVRRGVKREFISRCYNMLLRVGFRPGFTDAQCGFKAIRADVVRPLLDRVEDTQWFFDTELLLLAEYNGLRIHEVPVDWIEDVDSRVKVARTARNDLAGLVRVARAMFSGRALADLPPLPQLTPTHPDAVLPEPHGEKLARLLAFMAVGVVSTIVTTVLYVLLRNFWAPWIANLVALAITVIRNTEANRRWTFNRRPAGPRGRRHAKAGLLFALYYGFTTVVVTAFVEALPNAGKAVEALVLAVSYGVMAILRFAALDRWVFPRAQPGPGGREGRHAGA